MISQLRGKVVSKGAMEVVIDCAGVGYAVSVPLTTLDTVPSPGSDVTLLTILVVREDAMQLYGFMTTAEREAFRLLTSIQGIGGRIALGILSASTLDGLRKDVATGNVASLQRLPGIGKKTAERIVVELKEKILGVIPSLSGGSESASAGTQAPSEAVDDAISALQALGYNKSAAEKSVYAALKANPAISESSEELIRMALRQA